MEPVIRLLSIYQSQHLDKKRPAERMKNTILMMAVCVTTIVHLLWSGICVAQSGNLLLTDEEKSWIAANPIVKVGGETDWAPFDFIDRTGHYTGVGNDYLSVISTRTGLDFKVETATWSHLIANLDAGLIDMVPAIYHTADRESRFHFSSSYYEVSDHIYSRDDVEVSADIDLSDLTVALVRGFASLEKFRQAHPGVRILQFDSLDDAIHAVATYKAELLFDSKLALQYKLTQKSITNIKPISTLRDVEPWTLHMATRKDLEVLSNIISKVLAGMSQAEHQAIVDKWLGAGVEDSDTTGTDLDFLWILVCAALVFIMQAGFLCLESGLTRRKNSINVAIKNLADFCLSTVVFWVVGFGIMFGASQAGWFGKSYFSMDFSESHQLFGAFFLFQVMFCGAAVTIMSGAIAERMRFTSYLVVATLVSGLIYPVFGHWSWAGLDEGLTNGWLNGLGFVDFAGSTVVHSVGGWVSLAVLLIIGPRLGRFSEDGTPQKLPASNLSLATLGAVFLFIGWMGFNGGSTLALNASVANIVINTIIAGSFGAVSAGSLGYAVQNRLNVTQFINGALAGLVAITASCFAVTTPIAALIGLVGGMIAIGVEELLEKVGIDDAVGAIPVHLGAGIWGTLAVGLYADLDILGTGLTRLEQIWVQLIGIFSCGLWTFCVAYMILRLVNTVYPLRVSTEHEILGLNLAEHGEWEDDEPQGAIPAIKTGYTDARL
jgi:Amt family ammonium transporter